MGGTLISLIDDLESDFSINIIGACDSKRFLWNSEGIAPSMVQAELKNGERTEWKNILHRLTNRVSSELIFVDATGSAEVARLYPAILDANIHIATPSERANTFEQSFYERLQDIVKKNNVEFRYEPTVGAGLPVISTISDLLATGDTIHEISGVVSGTMTYLFNELEQGTAFSQAVRTARELGYAEPDPR
ncbi:MAG: hypothetical protein U5K69_29180 [Balneolaceae bacterium]|nr:hypothetical protein [Balneolaceae bacterium]